MRDKIKKHITYKIFIVTMVLLVTSSFSIYSILYFLLPNFYYKYKKNSIENALDKLVINVNGNSISEADTVFKDFIVKNNVSLVVVDSTGQVVYVPNILTSAIPAAYIGTTISGIASNPMEMVQADTGSNEGIYTSYRYVTFQNYIQTYTILVNATLQPIDEASKVLVLFLPYIGGIVFVISVTGAWIYSRLISDPLIKINKIARQMAHLNFEDKCKIKGEDEIGQLSESLNILSSNLRETMMELKDTNSKLLDDIEKERLLEKKRREFIATISHELKTPITIVKGQLEGMIGNVGVYKNHDKYMNKSLNVLEDMDHMVREILEISKIESQGFKPFIEEINLSKLLESTVEKLRDIANEKRIELITKIEGETYIQADEKLMRKVLTNILNNAIFHSENGAEVYLFLENGKDGIELYVENTGSYIDEEEIVKIFNPFYRVEKSRNRSTGGSGLGLCIVKMILDSHNVEYNISNSDRGVKFKIKFIERA